nr:hypothetical protein [Tanacetum cinerariifolium]
MPKSIHVDHHDTAFYIPKYHRTEGLNEQEKEIYKIPERHFFHEGRVIDPSYLEDQPNLRQTLATKFDYLLNINTQIYPVFVLEFYKSVRQIRNFNGTPISIACIIRNVEISLLLEEFSRILCVPCQGVCAFTHDWPISALPNSFDSNPDIYPPPREDFVLICDSHFYERPSGKTRKETILSENVINLTRNKDNLNAYLCYMLYCLTIKKPFNLAYYIAKRMESVTKSDIMALLYEMLLTRFFDHVRISYPFAITNNHYLVDHVMTHPS